MFELETGREHFFQWDTGQRLIIKDATIIEAHFCNRTDDCALVCEAYTDGGKRVVDVPNILLQNDWPIRVYAYCGSYTKVEKRFEVVKRSKPADYVYTETEVKNWEALENRVDNTLTAIERLGVEVSSAETQRETAEAQRIAAEEARAEAETERVVSFTTAMGDWNGAIVRSVNDANAATTKAETATAAANDAVNTLLNNAHAPAIVAENTAAIVCVDDAAATFAVGATSHIKAKQAGTGDATPDNVRAISGWETITLNRTAKNILPYDEYSGERKGVVFTSHNNGTYTLNGTATADAFYKSRMDAFTLGVLPAGKYTMSVLPASAVWNVRARVIKTGGQITVATTSRAEGIITFTADGITDYSVGFYVVSGATVSNLTVSIQLEAGENATEHEQYNGTTLTAELPETVYGGNLDWNTGVLTITHRVKTFNGTESWTKSGNIFQLQYVFSDGKGYTANEKYYHISSHYRATHWRTASEQIDLSCYTLNNSSLLVKDSTKATVDEFKAYLAEQADEGTPFTLIQPLKPAHYKTIQLSAQQLEMLKGRNTVWSESGDTDISYIADTKLYIDGKFAALQNAIVSLGSNV